MNCFSVLQPVQVVTKAISQDHTHISNKEKNMRIWCAVRGEGSCKLRISPEPRTNVICKTTHSITKTILIELNKETSLTTGRVENKDSVFSF